MERPQGCRCNNYSRFVLRGISVLQAGKPIYVQQKRIVAEVARVMVLDKDSDIVKKNVANALKILTENGRVKKAFESAYKIQMNASPLTMCACEDYYSDWCAICQYLVGNTIPISSIRSRKTPMAYCSLCSALHRRMLESDAAAESGSNSESQSEQTAAEHIKEPPVKPIPEETSKDRIPNKFQYNERQKRIVAAVAKMIYFDKYTNIVEDYVLNALREMIDTGVMNAAMECAHKLQEYVDETMSQIMSTSLNIVGNKGPSPARCSRTLYSSNYRNRNSAYRRRLPNSNAVGKTKPAVARGGPNSSVNFRACQGNQIY